MLWYISSPVTSLILGLAELNLFPYCLFLFLSSPLLRKTRTFTGMVSCSYSCVEVCVSPAHRVVSLNKELYSTLSLFTLVYKWVLPTHCWGVTLRWTRIPYRGEEAILLCMLHAKETGISSGCLGLWLVCTFTFLFYLVHTAVLGCQTS